MAYIILIQIITRRGKRGTSEISQEEVAIQYCVRGEDPVDFVCHKIEDIIGKH